MDFKKAQGISINVIVMLILGIIIFGMGIALFNKIYSSSDEQVEILNERVKSGLSALECQGDDWLCSPSADIRLGRSSTFFIYAVNRDEASKIYSIDMELENVGDRMGLTSECGDVEISVANIESNIMSGTATAFPYFVDTNRVGQTPCSFVTVAMLMSEGEEIARTPIIIVVD